MPKKKLFGNRQDPRCETCIFGKASADGSSVLCRRGGVLPKFHHCKHYQYDPLKRVPPRQKANDAFSAADFALDDWATAGAVVNEAAMAAGTGNEDALQKLRSYLDDTDAPDVNGIMAILSEVTETAEKAAADAPAKAEAVPVNAALTDPDIDRWSPDNTPDIAADLKTVEANLHSASAKAAFSELSMQLLDVDDYEDDDEDNAVQEDPSLLMYDTMIDEDDEDVLAADTLIFLSDEDLADATIETLSMNEDGSLSIGTEEL